METGAEQQGQVIVVVQHARPSGAVAGLAVAGQILGVGEGNVRPEKFKGLVTNIATVTLPPGTADPNLSNNSASDVNGLIVATLSVALFYQLTWVLFEFPKRIFRTYQN